MGADGTALWQTNHMRTCAHAHAEHRNRPRPRRRPPVCLLTFLGSGLLHLVEVPFGHHLMQSCAVCTDRGTSGVRLCLRKNGPALIWTRQ